MEAIRFGEQPAQFFQIGWFGQIVQREEVNFAGRVREMAVDFEQVGVAHHATFR